MQDVLPAVEVMAASSVRAAFFASRPVAKQGQPAMATMLLFALRNLSSRPTRTTLAVIGLSIPIVGIVGLITVSRGVRTLFGDSLGRMPGLVVLRENTPSPIFSDLPAEMADPIRRIPGVRVV